MKTKLCYLSLALIFGTISSCTPVEMTDEGSIYSAPPIYGISGEHSAEPDNEKD